MCVCIEVACWMHSGERQAAKIRMAYLRSMLNQDISIFDTESSTGEVISAITTDILVVQDAISEKVYTFFLKIYLSKHKQLITHAIKFVIFNYILLCAR